MIRAHRDTVVEFSDRNAKDSVTLDSPDLTLAKQVGGWTTKLRNMPDVAAPALDALTTAAEIATYAPDYTVPERVIVLSVRRFMAALALTGFITEAEARDRASIPAAIDSVFASLPTTPINQQTIARVTWATMVSVARNDPLILGIIASGYINPATGNPLTAAEVDDLFALAESIT
ncbi:MAG: hypothetical protein ACK559_15935 [bacterium]